MSGRPRYRPGMRKPLPLALAAFLAGFLIETIPPPLGRAAADPAEALERALITGALFVLVALLVRRFWPRRG
jgi:hypothetical protein